MKRYVVLRDHRGKWEVRAVSPMKVRDLVERFLAMLHDGAGEYTGIMLVERERDLPELQALCAKMNQE